MFRFAPSPTGDMHIDNLRIALLNYICATQQNEKLMIRFNDLDSENNIDGKDQEMLELLALFGIAYNDVTYQSYNLKFHQQLATKLLMDKHAFSCFCTPKEREEDIPYEGICENLSDAEVLNNESPFSVRVKRPDHDIIFKDAIKGEMHFPRNSIDSYIILNVAKFPSHNFATACDDLLGDISMIIRSEEHITDTPQQIMIREYLGYDKEITYAHLPPILHKEDDAFSVPWLLEQGFLPSAISNYLIMMGNKAPVDIFDLQDALSWFDLSKVSPSAVTFDIDTLRHVNKEHIKRTPAMEVAKFIGYSSKDLGELAKIYTSECSTINEIKLKIDAIFAKKPFLSHAKECETLLPILKKAPFFKEFDTFRSYLEKESHLEEEALLQALRLLLTGVTSGPHMSDIYPHIKNYLGEITQ